MTAPYQESYGDDSTATPDHRHSPGYWDDDFEETVWRYGDKQGNIWYDWIEHVWKCRCAAYRSNGICKHAYRYRRQDTITVREEYL